MLKKTTTNKPDKPTNKKTLFIVQSVLNQATHYTHLCLLTTFVAFPLLDLESQVKGADGEVDSLGVHSSHLADKRGSQITFQRLPLRTAKEREGWGCR